MGELVPVLFWGGPIGLGFFLMGVGVALWGLGKLAQSSNDVDKKR